MLFLKSFVFFFFLPIIAFAETFLANTSDIPVMNGLQINSAEEMDFDTPTGQLLVLEGVSNKKCGDEILKFYQTTLPQLGWKETEQGIFNRQNDSLTITILKNNQPSKVRFDISLTGDK
ncbi:MAG: hypothetical protein J6V53_03550 [Alphaproteobacteria bacterium]|nr:hypothetical protein [Alphaproteobacteria bacterium]